MAWPKSITSIFAREKSLNAGNPVLQGQPGQTHHRCDCRRFQGRAGQARDPDEGRLRLRRDQMCRVSSEFREQGDVNVPHCRACSFVSVAMTFSSCAFAQNAAPPHVPLQKTIGATKPQVVPSLIVFNSKGATLQSGKLVLTGIAQIRLCLPIDPFARPVTNSPIASSRIGGRAAIISRRIAERDDIRLSEGWSGVRDAVIVLRSPKIEGGNLFDVDILEGESRAPTVPHPSSSILSVCRSHHFLSRALHGEPPSWSILCRCRGSGRHGCSGRGLGGIRCPPTGLRILPISAMLLAVNRGAPARSVWICPGAALTALSSEICRRQKNPTASCNKKLHLT